MRKQENIVAGVAGESGKEKRDNPRYAMLC